MCISQEGSNLNMVGVLGPQTAAPGEGKWITVLSRLLFTAGFAALDALLS
jgi:hypothetical protein